MSKLRTEYVKSLGIELVVGDNFSAIGEAYIIGDYNVLLLNGTDPFNKFRFITHFAKRKNQLKVQPVDDDVPVVCYTHPHRDAYWGGKAKDLNWAGVILWAPSYSKLLEMQVAHDEKNASDEVELKELTLIDLRSTKWDLSEQSGVERRAWQKAFFLLGGCWPYGKSEPMFFSIRFRFFFIDEVGCLTLSDRNEAFQESSSNKMHFNDLVHADVNQVKTPLVTVKKDNLVYTQEMKAQGINPVVGMLVKCGFGVGVLKYIGHNGCIVNYNGDDKFCVAERLGYIDTRTLEQKQVDEVANIILDFPSDDYQELAELLRDKGLLAEIVKPLEN